jgi:DNA/RNA-binding domain of Phe-tRNA-synthetase-like protein
MERRRSAADNRYVQPVEIRANLMAELSIAELVERFPTFRVAFGLITGLKVSDSPMLDAYVRKAETEAHELLASAEIADLPEVAHWRTAYRAFGSKKTSCRDACEALLRRLRGGESLPRVLPLVDLYNAVSIRHRVPVGADDLGLVAPPCAFRYSRPGDSFLDGGQSPPASDPPAVGEVVYADSEKCLCRRWNWRQDARSRIRAETSDALIVIQTLEADGPERLARACEDFAALTRDAFAATSRWVVASADRPLVRL